ncbi:MAG: hypothetical protein HY587_02480 [Candidatus Omnitrophica bacterium]|nr:hypothetical protein [Candidatus Omnitrophota bacterium]
MKLHSYVVARDYGFAPNPFCSFCTLATCKPRIRKTAGLGDWIVGIGSKTRGRGDHIVYAMRVTEILTFDQYWNDPRFKEKKPNLRGSKKQAFGDNIYHRDSARRWCQVDSHHSHPDGSPNPRNIANDTKTTDRVLISDDFIYWGGRGPRIPKSFRSQVCIGIGHKNKFPETFVREFVKWLRSLGDKGYCGAPLDWKRSP